MVFSSTLFLFVFLPVTLFIYYIIKNEYRNYWLLLVSLLFFTYSQTNYLWIILLNIIVNYCCSMLIGNLQNFRRHVLIAAIIANLGILYYFKYFTFTLESLNKVLGNSFELPDIILPVGISFFTFQGMSYVIDVYRKDVPVQKNIFKVALYIVLFPQLIAGPIVRYKDVASEIEHRTFDLDDFSSGIERFIIGLSKKAVIANTMATTADAIWSAGSTNITCMMAWIGSIAYTLQIYFDFSGYSDMAIGLGRFFGFHFNENFNLPYISKNITEFWRRWHISLSTWFRDYVYIPLGGNRKNVYFNLSVVFLLTGIWHGASWHFLAWGIWNCIFIIFERFVHSKQICGQDNISVFKTVLSKIYTLLIVNLGWVLFRAPHTRDAIEFAAAMFGLSKPIQVDFSIFWYLDRWTVTVMAFAILFSSSVPLKAAEILKAKMNKKVFIILKYFVLLAILYLSMMRIVSGTYNPFIYFQF